jgi:tetratricopeptide (TPR) repeat protein
MQVSNTLGAYARFLSLSKDSRSGLADEYFLLSLDCADCDPLTAHTYHWYQCTAKKDFRSVSKYEQIRARSPVAGCGETSAAAIRRLEATEDKTSAGYADSAACLACFLDEICGMPDKARPLYDEAMRVDPSNSFARGKFASFLGRNDGDKGLARKMFDEAVRDTPGNAEALVDYARFMWSAGEIDAADDMFKRAISSVAEDSRVLGEYAAFKDGNGGDFVEVSSLYERSIAADSANSGSLSRYAALLASRGDAVGAAGAYKRSTQNSQTPHPQHSRA